MTADDHNLEREARERGRYLERTSDLTEREAHTDSDGEPPSASVIKSDRSPLLPTSHASGGGYKNEIALKPTCQNSRIRQQCYSAHRMKAHESGRTVLPCTLCPPQWHKTGTNLCHVSTLRNVGFYTNPAPRGDSDNVIDTQNRVSGVTSPERRLTSTPLRGVPIATTTGRPVASTGAIHPQVLTLWYLALVLTLHLSRWFERNIQFTEPSHESRYRKRLYAP